LEHEFYDFPSIGNFIIPTDFHIFLRGLKPPTSFDTYQKRRDQVTWLCSFSDFRLSVQTYRAHITNLEARQWRETYLFPGNIEFKQMILFLSSMHP
jgi:hypothetical protein